MPSSWLPARTCAAISQRVWTPPFRHKPEQRLLEHFDETDAIASAEELRGVKLVYDLVYNPAETRLLREAGMSGAKTIGGLEMLIAQGGQQFLIWTGNEAPVDVMKTAITERLPKTNAA